MSETGKISGVMGFCCTVDTPLLAGSWGGWEAADTTLQRSSVTGIPKVDGSVWKGAMAARLPFALEKNESGSFKGKVVKISCSELRLLFFAVQSVQGTFLLLTCPCVLKQFLNDMVWYGYLPEEYKDYLKGIESKLRDRTALRWGYGQESEKNWDVFGGMPYTIHGFPEGDIPNPFVRAGIPKETADKAILVSDREFKHFVWQETEFVTRNKEESDIETGRVVGTEEVFTEEYIPEGSVLYGFINEFMDVLHPAEVLKYITECLREDSLEQESITFKLQMGKNEALGKGWTTFTALTQNGGGE